MRAEEFRLGNYYKWHADGKEYYFKVDNSFFGDINVINNSEPIELTEEILLKCGFEKVRYEKYAHSKLNKLRAYPHVMKEGFGVYLMGSYTLPNIKHLHQLQNLYYALCNEELNVQL